MYDNPMYPEPANPVEQETRVIYSDGTSVTGSERPLARGWHVQRRYWGPGGWCPWASDSPDHGHSTEAAARSATSHR
jgi:hypothetical protein